MAPPRKPVLEPAGPSADSLRACRRGVRKLRKAAEFIGLSKSQLKILIAAGLFAPFKVGRDLVIPVEELIVYLAELRDARED